MSVFDSIRTALAQASDALTSQAMRFRNRTTMEAIVAGCAMISAADGKVDAEEKRKMIGFMSRNDAMKVFDTSEVIAAFNKTLSLYDFDAGIAKGEALNQVARLKGNSEAGQLLVRLCIAIGSADGNFDNDEKKVVREICKTLDLDPTDFGL